MGAVAAGLPVPATKAFHRSKADVPPPRPLPPKAPAYARPERETPFAVHRTPTAGPWQRYRWTVPSSSRTTRMLTGRPLYLACPTRSRGASHRVPAGNHRHRKSTPASGPPPVHTVASRPSPNRRAVAVSASRSNTSPYWAGSLAAERLPNGPIRSVTRHMSAGTHNHTHLRGAKA